MTTSSRQLIALLLAPTLFAQIPQNEVADRLTADLIALTSIPALPEGSVVPNPRSLDRLALATLKSAVKNRNPELDSAMQKFAADAAQRYDKYVIPWSLAYVLTSALAGKDLPRNSANHIATSTLNALDSAFVCRRTATNLRDSAPFVSALKTLQETLLLVGVSPPNVKIVIDNVGCAARLVVDPAIA
jgi:hypothetical protein